MNVSAWAPPPDRELAHPPNGEVQLPTRGTLSHGSSLALGWFRQVELLEGGGLRARQAERLPSP